MYQLQRAGCYVLQVKALCLFYPWDIKGRGCDSIYLLYGNLSDVLHLLCSQGCGAPFWWFSACLRQQTCLYFLALIFSALYLNEAFLVPSKLRILLTPSHKMALLLPSLRGRGWGWGSVTDSALIPLITQWLRAKLKHNKLVKKQVWCARGGLLGSMEQVSTYQVVWNNSLVVEIWSKWREMRS